MHSRTVPTAPTKENVMDFAKQALALEPTIIQTRRQFHSHPELSWEETATTARIAQTLNELGYEVQLFARTGVLAKLRGGKAVAAPKTVLLRADIDALPIQERTGLPFASQNPGVMHACGHDTHTAMLLGAATLLWQARESFGGEVRLLFQGAEETSDGSRYYIQEGVLDGVDAVFGMHIWGDLDAPLFSIEQGARMASCDNFKMTVRGKASHGSAPQQGVDAIVAAAAIVMQVQTLVSRQNDPRNPLVVTIGKIRGGERFNIIADEVEMIGTVRSHSKAVREALEGKLRGMAENIAAAYGATVDMEYSYLASPVLNHPDALVQLARDAAVKLYGADALGILPPLMSSEDFSSYLDLVPGVFCFLGARNTELGLVAANHNDTFTVDEAALVRGTALYAQFACDFLNAAQ